MDKSNEIIEKLKTAIENDFSNIQLLFDLADEYIKIDQQGNAINVLNKILEIDADNKSALVKREQQQQILRFRNTDIFENTNLNNDPWLD